jgi:4-hydroxy-2-oxoheptanedioate aldolase
MNWIRERALKREILSGTWLNLGSSITAEIAGLAGFDWVVVDLEHGAGGHDSALHQLQAISATPAAPLVRVVWNEAPRVKRVLDLGAAGVVIPYVQSSEEAELAVGAVRYPPEGVRGAASITRAAGFGAQFREYLTTANDKLLSVIQIETERALASVEEIAAVAGVDVLFVGPLDLSINLGIATEYDNPRFRAALAKVSAAARSHGKAAGILLSRPEQLEQTVADGFSFIGLGSDGGVLAEGMRGLASAFGKYR